MIPVKYSMCIMYIAWYRDKFPRRVSLMAVIRSARPEIPAFSARTSTSGEVRPGRSGIKAMRRTVAYKLARIPIPETSGFVVIVQSLMAQND